MQIFSVDPGIRYFGWGLFEHSRLISCGFCYVPDLSKMPKLPLCEYVVESQYMSKSPTVIGLARMVGALVTHSTGYRLYTPQSWKGSVSKKVSHVRILECLDARERAIFADTVKTYIGPDKQGKQRKRLVLDMAHDVSHGIGVGLTHLGRYGQ